MDIQGLSPPSWFLDFFLISFFFEAQGTAIHLWDFFKKNFWTLFSCFYLRLPGTVELFTRQALSFFFVSSGPTHLDNCVWWPLTTRLSSVRLSGFQVFFNYFFIYFLNYFYYHLFISTQESETFFSPCGQFTLYENFVLRNYTWTQQVLWLEARFWPCSNTSQAVSSMPWHWQLEAERSREAFLGADVTVYH